MSRFKELRLATGMTQEEFRQQFNRRFNRTYTAAAISQFENGKRTPEISALIDFADFFKVSLDDLMNRKPPRDKPALSADELSLVADYRALDDRGKQFIRDSLEMSRLRLNAAFRQPAYQTAV